MRSWVLARARDGLLGRGPADVLQLPDQAADHPLDGDVEEGQDPRPRPLDDVAAQPGEGLGAGRASVDRGRHAPAEAVGVRLDAVVGNAGEQVRVDVNEARGHQQARGVDHLAIARRTRARRHLLAAPPPCPHRRPCRAAASRPPPAGAACARPVPPSAISTPVMMPSAMLTVAVASIPRPGSSTRPPVMSSPLKPAPRPAAARAWPRTRRRSAPPPGRRARRSGSPNRGTGEPRG